MKFFYMMSKRNIWELKTQQVSLNIVNVKRPLTRAKKKVILLTLKNRESVFVTEFKYNYAEQMRREAFTCPLCGGALIKKNGKYGEFWGCVNFSKTNCNFTRKANN